MSQIHKIQKMKDILISFFSLKFHGRVKSNKKNFFYSLELFIVNINKLQLPISFYVEVSRVTCIYKFFRVFCIFELKTCCF